MRVLGLDDSKLSQVWNIACYFHHPAEPPKACITKIVLIKVQALKCYPY